MAAPRVAMPVAQPVARPVAAAVAAPVASPTAAAAPAASPASASASASASSSFAPVVPIAVAASAAAVAAGGEQVDAKIIMDLPLSRVYVLVDGSKRLVETATLELVQSSLDGEDVYLLLIGDVRLALRINIPCLEMAPRNFVFPTDQRTYGLVVADTITDEVMDVFRVVLQENTSFRSAAAPQPISALPDVADRVVTTANSVAAGLGAGSVVVATGVIRGGKYVGGLVMRGGEYLASKLTPNAQATTVSEQSKARLTKAKFLSGAACKVSKALVVGAMATTELMASQLSDAIKETEVGKKLASDPDRPNARLDAAKTVGKATIGAVLNVYQAIETAVFGVAHDVASSTVTVVTHKYGAEAGAHTKESLGVVENVAVAARGIQSLGVKSIAKKTAIKASQEVLTTPAERAREQREREQAAAAAGPAASIGRALGLPDGMDPLVAMEAVQAAAQLSAAGRDVMAQQNAAPAGSAAARESVVVTTATATGSTPARAQAAAQAAANAGAQAAIAQPISK